MHKNIKKIASFLTAITLTVGGFAALGGPLTAAADNSTPPSLTLVGAVPSTGTVDVGSPLQVYFQAANDEGDLTLNGACLVNNVNVNSTFQNDTDGLYQVTYTVGANDISAAAGDIPINCTLANSVGSTTSATAWTDSNTTAIDATAPATVAPELGGATASPTSGMLAPGDQLQLYIRESHGMNDLTLSGACLINGVNVNSTFQNDTNGLYQVTYTVGAHDSDQAAGQVPINCSLSDSAGSITATAWTDNNTVGINADGNNPGSGSGTGSGSGSGSGSGGGTSTSTPVMTAGMIPTQGTLSTGDSIDVYFQDANHENDLSVVGSCLINNENVNSTFHNDTNGLYQFNYTVGASDLNAAAGQIPVNCTFTNGTSTETVTSWGDSNTVAVDTGNTGSGSGTGTSTMPTITASAIPSTGTLLPNNTLTAYFQAANNENDLALDGACLINGVNVNSTFHNDSGGLYQATYTVGANDTDRTAGQVPINCTFENPSMATTAITAWTDGNTVAVDVDGNSGGNGSGNNGSNTNGNINGTVNSSNGVLAVNSITQVNGTAIADGTFADGWSWIFNVTVPTNETSFSMQFGNWTDPNDASSTIPVANNMRISSDQASTSTPVTITGANTYTIPLTLNGDMDNTTAGRQIQVKVEMAVPAGTPNGSYTTTYGVQSTQ